MNQDFLQVDIPGTLLPVAAQIISGFNFRLDDDGNVVDVDISGEVQEMIHHWGNQERLDEYWPFNGNLKDNESYGDMCSLYKGCIHEAALHFTTYVAQSEGEDELVGYFFTLLTVLSDLLKEKPKRCNHVVIPKGQLPPS